MAKGAHARASRKVKVMNKGQMDIVDASKVDHILRAPHNLFDVTTNLIPFLNSTQGTRGMTAAKMSEQALPLVGREAPRVQAAADEGEKTSFEEIIGQKFSVTAPIDGRVSNIKANRMTLIGKNGKRTYLPLHDHYPLNQKQFLHHEATVKVGDQVKKGQLVADSNFTRGGTLALGRSLRVAYMPYKGYTLEDAGVISESAAKKLTSEHLYKIDVELDDGSVLNKRKFKAHDPRAITTEHDAKLDDRGVIKKGQTVKPDDILVAHLRRETVTADDDILRRLHKSLGSPWKNRAQTWDHGTEGEVTDVIDMGKKVRIFVKTQEPAKVGDKVAGRYGNKSIITSILPDGEMPHMQDGTPVDAIFDPHTIPSRINPSQQIEAAAGRAAKALGRTFKVKNFDNQDALERVKGWMKQAGLNPTGRETLTDPGTNRKIPGIFVGDHYVQKLKHKVDTKFIARNIEGHDVNDAPRKSPYGAQSLDNLMIYSMLAHGNNRNILREMATDYKASRNPEVWRAVQMGHHLPKPKPTFAYNKFLGYIKGMGVNVDQDKDGIMLSPMTDAEIEAQSSGSVLRPDMTLRGKDLKPITGGLFDPQVFGGSGIVGDQWGHIDLAVRMPNPITEKATRIVGKMSSTEYNDILSGKKGVDQGWTNRVLLFLISQEQMSAPRACMP